MGGYKEAFDGRGSSYDQAMRACPEARAGEFDQLIRRAGLLPGMRLADVPAGGGYLARWLPQGVVWLGHEPCASFQQDGGTHGAGAPGMPLFPFPWADASVDRVVSLAGVHHQDDKRPFHAEARRVLRADGRYVLSDVAEGSATARFLDSFVGRHNSTGHNGSYLGPATLGELVGSGFRVLSDEPVGFHWVFADQAQMVSFCTQLFDLRGEGPARLPEAAERLLGVDLMPGSIGLRWSLRTIVCEPA